MVQAIRISETGGPEVMVLEEVLLDALGPGMVIVENRAIGLNCIDTYHRSGLYRLLLLLVCPLAAALLAWGLKYYRAALLYYARNLGE